MRIDEEVVFGNKKRRKLWLLESMNKSLVCQVEEQVT